MSPTNPLPCFCKKCCNGISDKIKPQNNKALFSLLSHRFSNHTYLHKEKQTIFGKILRISANETSKPSIFRATKYVLFPEYSRKITPSYSHVAYKHILSHQIIDTNFYKVKIPDSEIFSLSDEFRKIPIDNISDFPVSRLIHKYLEKF